MYFTSDRGGRGSGLEDPAEGGTPQLVLDTPARDIHESADGKVLYYWRDGRRIQPRRVWRPRIAAGRRSAVWQLARARRHPVPVERQPAAASRDRGGVARDAEAVSGPRAGRLAARTVSARLRSLARRPMVRLRPCRSTPERRDARPAFQVAMRTLCGSLVFLALVAAFSARRVPFGTGRCRRGCRHPAQRHRPHRLEPARGGADAGHRGGRHIRQAL